MTREVALIEIAIDIKDKDEFTVKDLMDMFENPGEMLWRRRNPIYVNGELCKYTDSKTVTFEEVSK